MTITAPIPRDERHLMRKALHKTRDKNHARWHYGYADAVSGEVGQ